MAKAKAMTLKQFKQVLEDAGLNFEVWGWEGILNMISGYNDYLAEQALRIGGMSYAYTHSKEAADKIFKALEERGYYDDTILTEVK